MSDKVQKFRQKVLNPPPTKNIKTRRKQKDTMHISESFQHYYSKIQNFHSDKVLFWKANSERNKKSIYQDISTEEFVSNMTVNFDYTIDGMAIREQNKIVDAISWLKWSEPDVEYSLISDYIHPEVVKDGSSVTHCSTNIMRHRLEKYIDLTECSTILEIGAGYGAFAREILLKNGDIKYVIIDLPEGVVTSYAFLSLEFPDKKHVMAGIDDIEEFDILYIPSGYVDEITDVLSSIEFDLFVNTCSMGEMKNDVIKGYYDLITDKLSVKSVYWLNRFLNTWDGNTRKDGNGCMVTIPKEWHIKHWENMPKFLQCPDIMSYHAKMVEIYATIEITQDKLENNKSNKDKLFQLWNRARLRPSKKTYTNCIEGIREVYSQAEEINYYTDNMP